MGLGYSVPPTADDRIVKAMQTFNLKVKDVAVMWAMFKKHDKTRGGIIGISSFYSDILFVPRTIFCDGLFDLIEAADSEAIDFGEFVAAVTTYCFFEIPEVLKFCFFVFDRDKKGFITQEEMRLFVDAMHGNEMSTNVEFALDNLKYRKDGKFDFEEFKVMHHLYPSVLFPAFRLQNAMMMAMGGERFWENKKLALSMQKEDERKKEANREARERAEAYKYREDQVRRHMGGIKYYLIPKNRAKYYEVYPLPKKYRLLEEQAKADAKREKQLAEMRKKQKAAQ